MHSVCVALLFFVLACSAQDIEDTVTCCAPRLLQGDAYTSGITFTRGRNIYFNANTRYYYSEVKKKIATYSVVMVQGLGNVTVNVLNDFNTGRGYTVTNGRCRVTRLPKTFPRNCIPSSAVYLGSLKVGSASRSLRASSYKYTVKPSFSTSVDMFSFKYRYGLSCYDIASSINIKTSTGALKTRTSMIMGNFKTSIPFSSVFNVPSECSTYMSPEMENMFDETAFDFIKYII